MNSTYKIKHFALIVALGCINFLHSATRTWTGTTNSTWTTTTNWVSGNVPTTSDTVVINSGSSNYPSLSFNITIMRLRLNGGSLTTGSNNLTMSSSAFIAGGTLNATSGTITVSNGNLTLSSGTINSTSGAISVTNGNFIVSGGTLSKTGSGTVTTGADLVISGGSFSPGTGTLDINSDIFMSNGTFTKTSGNIDITADLNLSGGNFSKGSGTLTATDDMNISGGIFNANSSNTYIGNELIMTAGLINGGTSTIRSFGLATLSDGKVYIGTQLRAANALTLSGARIIGGSGSDITATTLNISSDSVNFGSSVNVTNLTISGGIVGFGAADINISTTGTISAGVINAGTSLFGNTGTNTITINGGTLNATTIGLLQCQDLTMNGGTVNMAGNKFDITDDCILDGATLNISVANMHLDDDFFIKSGTLDLNTFSLTIDNEFIIEGGTITDPASSLYTQDLTLDFSGTFILNFTLNVIGNTTVPNIGSGSAVFSNGILKTSATNLLILGAGVSVGSADNSSHVAGPVRKLISTTVSNISPFAFPIGNGTVYAPIEISSFQSTRSQDYFTAQYDKDYAPYNHASKDASIHHISDAEYWVLDRGASSGTATATAFVKLYYNASRSGSITSSSNLKLTKWDGSTWKDLTATVNTGQGTLITNSRVTTFSPFTLASGSTANPLPVHLLSFTATPAGKQVNLNWATTEEINNKFFTVQKSLDGKTWSVIGIVNAAQNPALVNNYSLIDRTPVMGMQYYRLIQTDINGKSTTSEVVSANFMSGTLPNTVTVAPNPANDQLNITLSQSSANTNISIFNTMGVKVMELNNQSGASLKVDMSNLPGGVYIVEVHTENEISISKIIKN